MSKTVASSNNILLKVFLVSSNYLNINKRAVDFGILLDISFIHIVLVLAMTYIAKHSSLAYV